MDSTVESDGGAPYDATVGAESGSSGGGGADASEDGPWCDDGGAQVTQPITFNITVSGTLPPPPDAGAAQYNGIYVVLAETYRPWARFGEGAPSCGGPQYGETSVQASLVPATLPAQLSMQIAIPAAAYFDGGAFFCGAGFAVLVYWDFGFVGEFSPGDGPDTQIATERCGCWEGLCANPEEEVPNYGAGGPALACSPVVCNVDVTP